MPGFIALLFACGDPMRQDELDCEEAVSYLEGCCPGFQATSRIQCVYSEGCGNTTYPDISEGDSTCIRAQSCADLRASGTCDLVEKGPAATGSLCR